MGLRISIIIFVVLFSFFAFAKNKIPVSIDQKISNILSDPNKIISDQFSIPKELIPRVVFWMNIYSKYTSREKVFHDKENPEIVYEVFDSSTYDYVYKRKISSSIASQKNESKYYVEIKGALYNIYLNNKPTTTLEHKYFKTIKKYYPNADRNYFLRASNNVRVQSGQKEFMIRGIATSRVLIPYMESVFEREGLPIELTRIPFVESSFNYKATSKVGAAGVWQFMNDSGSEYMLINPYFDERLSPIKATFAAAKLLKRNHSVLGSWPLAVTAYNHGLKTFIDQKSHKKPSRAIASILTTKAPSYGFASKNFYSEFLAALYVEKYSKQIFGNEIPKVKLSKLRFLTINEGLTAYELADKVGVSFSELASYNPDIKFHSVILPIGYKVILPSSTIKIIRNVASAKPVIKSKKLVNNGVYD